MDGFSPNLTRAPRIVFRPWQLIAIPETALGEIDPGDGDTVAINVSYRADGGGAATDKVIVALGKGLATHVVAVLGPAAPNVTFTYATHGDAIFGPVFVQALQPDSLVTVTRAIRKP